MTIENKTKLHYSDCKERNCNHPVVLAFSKPKLDWVKIKTNLKGKRVLEVGAGNGYFSNILRKLCNLTVLDISSHQLKYNPEKQQYIGSVYKLPFKDDSYDVVLCSNLLHHLDFPQDAVNEMKRVAKTEVIISEPNRNNPILFIGALIKGHERKAIKYSKRYISKMIEKSGMNILRHTYIGGMVMPNATPTFMLPFVGAKSKNRLSFFQLFSCGV